MGGAAVCLAFYVELPPNPTNRLHRQHPRSPSFATRTNEGILDRTGWGQNCKPITPKTGAKLHAGSQTNRLRPPPRATFVRLTFPEPIDAPIVLSYGSHFWLGQFVPEIRDSLHPTAFCYYRANAPSSGCSSLRNSRRRLS
jgi:hypothetical protein